jgi:hypothetical protein
MADPAQAHRPGGGMSERSKHWPWWTPAGWEHDPAPDEFLPTLAADDIAPALEGAGYIEIARIGNAGDFETSYEVSVYFNRHDKHLYVDVSGDLAMWCEFFVQDLHRAAFFVDKLPALIGTIGNLESSRELRLIRRALISFIRHGEGESTIDADGLWTFDEQREQRANLRRRREAEAAKAAKDTAA